MSKKITVLPQEKMLEPKLLDGGKKSSGIVQD
jgi:hypothetical protein